MSNQIEDRRMAPTEQELYHCNASGIVQLYLPDKRIDPTINNCQPLEQAIRNSWTESVRVYLCDQRVAKLVDERTLSLARQFGTDEIVGLVEKAISS